MSSTTSPVRVQRTPKHGWRNCNCCPYGYHIDLDFVRYCESVSDSQMLPKKSGLGNHNLRRKRASMEVMLGISPQSSPKKNLVQQHFSDPLQTAVQDFENTLKRTSSLKIKKNEEPVMVNGSAHQVNRIDESKQNHVESKPSTRTVGVGCTVLTRDVGVTHQTLLKTIGLNTDQEIPRVPEPVQVLKPLTVTSASNTDHVFCNTTASNTDKLLLIHRSVGDDLRPLLKTVGSNTLNKSLVTTGSNTDKVVQKTDNRSLQTDPIELPEVKPAVLRDVSVNTDYKIESVAPPRIISLSKSSQTKQTKENVYKSTLSNTDLHMDQIYSQTDLERNIDKAIQVYEKTYNHLLHPKKPLLLNAGVQVEYSNKEIGTQVITKFAHFGANFKPSTKEIGVITGFPIKEEIKIVTVESCAKCKVKTADRQVQCIIESDEDKNKLKKILKMKSVGCGPERYMTTSKSTDTSTLIVKKDISVNTMKRKLVDSGVDPIESIKNSAPSSPLMKSRIPRPTVLHLNSSPKPPISPVPPVHHHTSHKFRLQIDDSNDDESDYGRLSERLAEASIDLFQPINEEPRVKKEPSKEMKGALKVLNDALISSGGNASGPLSQMDNAVNIIQQEWFKVTSTATANPLDVEDYLDCFEEMSADLLEYIVNMTDTTGNTAMHYAVSHGNFDVVSILLDSKVCNINKPNAAGYSCIMLVSLAEVKSATDKEVVRRLFNMADINIRAKQHGQTALMLAVSHGKVETVELLLEAGADINIQDDDGSTALMCAAEHGYLSMVKLLLAQPDCDLSITDCDGSTALSIALEAGNRDIAVLLYAQEHFSAGSSPYSSAKRRSKSSPMFRTPPRTPTSPVNSKPITKKH